MNTSLNTAVLLGDITDIKKVSKNLTIIRLACHNFSKNEDATTYNEIKAFGRHAKVVAQLQEMLDARREETGDENSALKNVKLYTYIEKQGKSGDYKCQSILNRVMVDKVEVVAPGVTNDLGRFVKPAIFVGIFVAIAMFVISKHLI